MLPENLRLPASLREDMKNPLGKLIEGSIKETIPLIKEELNNWLLKTEFDPEQKVKAVKNIYNELEISKLTEGKIDEFFALAFENLDKIEIDQERIYPIRKFTEKLMQREQ